MTSKIVYQIDYAGHYAGQTEADESPLEPGVFLIPARCVEVPPPESWPEDRWPRFNGKTWDLVLLPQAPEPVPEITDPVSKLQAFLIANPDVASLISKQ